jgi:cysteine synthase A
MRPFQRRADSGFGTRARSLFFPARFHGRSPTAVSLSLLSAEPECEILGQAGFLDPRGSINERAALAMPDAAERSGAPRPGGRIVEGTAGNTGAALALFARQRGCR